jgi:hydrogenase maturation protease
MRRSLVIGYGNLDRHDDGLGFYIVNRLRRHLGQKPLAFDDDGVSRLGRCPDSIFIRQLVPELIVTAAGYDRLVFVDAHIPADLPHLRCTRIAPGDSFSGFTHQLHPAAFLGLLQVLYGREPVSHLLSVMGSNFDFGRGLSVDAGRLLEPAIEVILKLVKAPFNTGSCRNRSKPAADKIGEEGQQNIHLMQPH